MHHVGNPAILYFGTPVALTATVNEDGSFNLAPMSSVWWLGVYAMLGLATTSKTTQNLLRTGECVLSLPSERQVSAVDRLARTTGSDPVPEGKRRRGYRFEKDKFAIAGLTPIAADLVAAPRVLECPVHLEARVESTTPLAADDVKWRGRAVGIGVRIVRVHLDETIRMAGDPDRIDPDRWRPLIMSFQEFYGLTPGRLQASELAKIPEALYRV